MLVGLHEVSDQQAAEAYVVDIRNVAEDWLVAEDRYVVEYRQVVV